MHGSSIYQVGREPKSLQPAARYDAFIISRSMLCGNICTPVISGKLNEISQQRKNMSLLEAQKAYVDLFMHPHLHTCVELVL